MPDKPMQVKNVRNSVIVGGSVSGPISNFSSEKLTTKSDDEIAILLSEISTLRQAMKQLAKTVEEDSAVGKVADVEKALVEKDLPKAIEYIKMAGKWALDVAKQIGVPIAVEFIKQALAIK